MRNDFDGPFWADNHTTLSDGIASMWRNLAYAFKRAHAIRYNAPWARD